MALPTNVGTGTVTGKFLDSFGNPIAGTIVFTPSPRTLKNVSASPKPVTILPKPVTVTLTGGEFTQVVVATNDADNNPTNWTYQVDYRLTDVTNPDSHSITVPEGATVDLTVVAPVSSSSGDAIVRGYGVAVGGSTGQVLVKTSSADGATAWQTITGSGFSAYSQVAALPGYPSSFTPTVGTTGTTAAAGNDSRFTSGLNRANHTGTQTSATISDLTEYVQDVVGGLLQGANGVGVTYDDASNSLIITGSGASGVDAETVRDTIGVALVGLGNISVTVNDGADTITIATSATVNSTDAALRDRTTHTGSQLAATISDLPEAVQDIVAAFIATTGSITKSYDDAGNVLTLNVTGPGGGSGTAGFATLPTSSTTDMGSILQAAYDSNLQVRGTPGSTYLLDSPVFFDDGDQYDQVVWDFRGCTINLGPNLPQIVSNDSTTSGRWSATRFAVFPNNLRSYYDSTAKTVTVNDTATPITRATGSGSGMVNTHFIAWGGKWDGMQSTEYRAAVFLNRAPVAGLFVTASRCRVWSTFISYTDTNLFLHCYNRGGSGPDTSRFFEQYAQGDGLVVIGGKADSSVDFLNLTRNRGAHISGLVTASVSLTDCSAVTLAGCHQEGQQSSRTMLTVKSSQVLVDGGTWYENWDAATPTTLIDDSASTENGSDVVFRDTICLQLHQANSSESVQFGPWVQVLSTQTSENTRIRFEGVRSKQQGSGIAGKAVQGTAPFIAGPSGLNTLMSSPRGLQALARGTFTVQTGVSGAWKLETIGAQVDVSNAQSGNPSLPLCTATTGLIGTLTNGQAYSYAVMVQDAGGRFTAVSADVTATPGTSRSIRLLLRVVDAPGVVIVFRKAASSGAGTTPTSYAVMPCSRSRNYAYDTGTYINGRPWVTYSAGTSPAPSSSNSTEFHMIYNGVEYPDVPSMLANEEIGYAAAYALSTRPSVLPGRAVIITGGAASDPWPSWATDADRRIVTS